MYVSWCDQMQNKTTKEWMEEEDIVFYLSISIELLTARAFQKQQSYCIVYRYLYSAFHTTNETEALRILYQRTLNG